MLARKSITTEKSEFEKISKITHKEKISFSEILKKAMNVLKKHDDISLTEYIKKNCEYVSEKEEKELLDWINELDEADLDPDEGSKLTLEQIIKGNLL